MLAYTRKKDGSWEEIESQAEKRFRELEVEIEANKVDLNKKTKEAETILNRFFLLAGRLLPLSDISQMSPRSLPKGLLRNSSFFENGSTV